MSLLADIKTLLTGTVYKNSMPDTPDNITCLYDTGGFPPEHELGSSNVPIYYRPTIQVRVRDVSYENAYTRIKAIRAVLDEKTNATINGNLYIRISTLSDILTLGQDSKGRTELTINFEIWIKEG